MPTLIPVADAPLQRAYRAPARAVPGMRAQPDGRFSLGYIFLLLCVVINFTGLGIVGLASVQPPIAVIVFRYLLWPAILVGAIPVLVSNGLSSLRSIAMLLPLWAIGIVASFSGFALLISLRLMFFWSFGMLAAAVIGQRLSFVTAGRTLLAFYFLMVVASIGTAYLFPDLGTQLDEHGKLNGAWSGLFAGKSAFGEILVYCSLFAVIVPRVPLLVRAIVLAATIVALYKARSVGADIALVAACYYVVLTRLMNRLRLPDVIKSMLTLVTLLISGAVAAAAGSLALSLIGKDLTLSGRTQFWPAWFARALESPILGFGPGAFTIGGSPVVVDLSARFESFGYIVTPHNMFIAVLGEVGIAGVLAFFLPLLYLALLMPYRLATREALFAGALAFVLLISGIDETRETLGLSINTLLSFLFYTSALRSSNETTGPVAQAGPAVDAGAY